MSIVEEVFQKAKLRRETAENSPAHILFELTGPVTLQASSAVLSFVLTEPIGSSSGAAFSFPFAPPRTLWFILRF